MKTTFIIIINLFLCASLSAQERFFEFIPGWMTANITEIPEGYLCMGLGAVEGGLPTDHNYISSELSLVGDVVESTIVELDTVLSITLRNKRGIIIPVGNQKIVAGSKQVLEYNYDGMLVWYNEDLSEVDIYRSYDFGIDTRFSSINQVNDSTIMIGGHVKPTNYNWRQAILLNMDLEGNIRWQKDFSCGTDCNRYLQNVLPTSDDGFVLVCVDFIEVPLETWTTGHATIIKTDAYGIVEWIRNPGDWENYYIIPGGAIETADGEILVSYSDHQWYADLDTNWPDYGGNHDATIYTQKYSLEGDSLSSTTFFNNIPNGVLIEEPFTNRTWPYQLTDMIPTQDGNVLIVGTTNLGGVLVKCTEDGEFLWYREHMPYDYYNDENTASSELVWILGVTSTSDGGYICAGEYMSSPGNIYPGGYQSAFALKVDEYGCLEPGCQFLGIEESSSLSEMHIYPNPTGGQFTLSFEEYSAGSISVFDLTGKLVLEKKFENRIDISIDLSSFTSGLYIVKCLSDEGEVYSARVILDK